jgi:hypothetical protein
LGGPQSRSGRYGEVKIFLPYRDSNSPPPGRPARSQSLYRLSYPGSRWIISKESIIVLWFFWYDLWLISCTIKRQRKKSVKWNLDLLQIIFVKDIDKLIKDDSIKNYCIRMYSEDIESVVYEDELWRFCILSTVKISYHWSLPLYFTGSFSIVCMAHLQIWKQFLRKYKLWQANQHLLFQLCFLQRLDRVWP